MMFDYDSAIFQPCKEWIADALNAGKGWDDILTLCVSSAERESKLADLIDEFMWPEDLTLDAWEAFVEDYKTTHITVTMAEGEPVIAIDNGIIRNQYPVPYGITSSWEQYKAYLKTTMSEVSVSNIQKSCTWILNHLSSDTRKIGAIKGLVTGSVQSGKTANMEGLVSMAADYDWNFFIILSGTIDNLRKQTRDRFKKDLHNSEGILWRILDFTGEDKRFCAEELKLNPLTGSKNFSQRYVTVCLKNRKRLEKLIDWLYDDPNRTSKLRILVIDDEADQASINTAEITQEEEQERCAINQLICNLVNGKKSDGVIPEVRVQAVNYISFTATPYANVLNESSVESLYPKDFICTLPEATEYFGAKVIFGNNEQECPGFPILREVNFSENKLLKEIQKKKKTGLPDSMKQAISWFLCATSVLRVRGHKKSISMLVHTSSIQKEHFVIYDEIQNWLADKSKVIDYCREVYTKEAHAITKADLQEANPDYGLLSSVREDMPTFEELLGELNALLSNITNILLGEDKSLEYTSGLHLCVDNCSANREAEEGTYLRIVYPTDEQLKSMEKAPAFLVIGGNTLSRGLTIDGLVCTFFSRTSNQADTLMQMARWFGYGQTIRTIIETLEEELEYRVIGVTLDDDGNYVYTPKSFIRNSRYFGVPQNRPRVFIMAFSKKRYGEAVKVLTEGLPTSGSKTIFEDVHQILEPDVDIHYYMASGYWETLKRHKERQSQKGYGFGYCVVNTKDEEHPVANTILATGGSGKERNLVYQPKEGVGGTTIPSKKTELNHEGIRVMTPTEWGRLQGFVGYAFMKDGVDTFSFPKGMTDGQKYKQLGNSVTIPVIEELAHFMLSCFDKMTNSQTSLVLKIAMENKYITKKDVMEKLRISANQAGYILKKLLTSGDLEIVTHGRYSKYQITPIE